MSETVRIDWPDGTSSAVPRGETVGAALRRWAPSRADSFLAALVDGEPRDLAFRLEQSARVEPLTFEERAGRDIVQHSAAHVVAKAVLEVIPSARPTHGPPTDDGFFYDFEVRPLTADDLDRVRESIDRSIKDRLPFVRKELSLDEARSLFASNPHKLGYLADATEPRVSVYETGSFVDLCRGPHVPDTSWLAGLHILGTSAIQSGDGAAPLQRVRGIAFPTKERLAEYLRQRAEAEARDHRAIGQRLELFQFEDEAPGFPFWLPHGMIVVRELEAFVLEHLRRAGYSEVRTPLLFAQSVYETSGHWELYRDHMFVTEVDDRTFGWKPMNCPGSMMIFRSRSRSYRELPMRLAEFAPLHRREASGTLHGLTRVREFVQDDAHLFVTEDQIEGELRTLMDWIREVFTTFRLSWSYELSTRPPKYLGEPEQWDRAEATLQRVLTDSGVPFRISKGEGAFYGPKIDIHVNDSLGRPWQTGTIQLDYQMPRRFQLTYQGPDGALHTPVVIHRTILGSWERFLGVLLEHCAGKLPPWLCPVQVRVLPVTEAQTNVAEAFARELRDAGLRAEASAADASLPKRVRSAEIDRIPYIVVLGEREVADGTASLRRRSSKDARVLARSALIAELLGKIRSRSFEP